MPVKCSVPGCPTKSEKGSGQRLYCIPSEINYTGKSSPLRASRRKKWISALKLEHLQDHQLKNIRVCGEHFNTGKPADQYFEEHPDWVPSLKLNLKESRASALAKNEFLNKLQLDVTKKNSSVFNKKTIFDDNDAEFEEMSRYSMPQKRCCVASCTNRISKTKNSSPPIHYHKFPDDLLTRQRWMYLCQKKGTWDPDQSYICSEHFKPECYVQHTDGELKSQAVPTLKLLPTSGGVISLEKKPGVCSVPWCKSNTAEGTQMTSFPTDEEESKIWINNIFNNQVPVVPSEDTVVCEDHFAEDQWIKAFGDKKLKKNPIPSVFYVTSFPATTPKKKTETLQSPAKKNDVRTPIKKMETEIGQEVLNANNEKFEVNGVVKLLQNNNVVVKKMGNTNNKELSADKVVRIVKIYKRHKEEHEYSEETLENKKMKLINNEKCKKGERIPDDVVTIVKTHLNTGSPKMKLADNNSEDEDYLNLTYKSNKKLKELAEAQKFQIEDLKNENKELIEENERLRNEINLFKSDCNYSTLVNEKSKFVNNIVKIFKNFMNVDQILSLVKGDPSIAINWSKETLDIAREIHKACSDSGYDKLIDFGYPLPPRCLFLHNNQNNLGISNNSNT